MYACIVLLHCVSDAHTPRAKQELGNGKVLRAQRARIARIRLVVIIYGQLLLFKKKRRLDFSDFEHC